MIIWNWIRLGPFLGILAATSYGVLLAVPMPLNVAATLACVFGLSISGGALGMYHFLSLNKVTVTLQIATGASIIAGVLVLTMLIVQFSVNDLIDQQRVILGEGGESAMLTSAWMAIDRVQLGFDIAWDIFIGVGTVLIAWNMRTHARFGQWFGWLGIGIGGSVLFLNLYTFPIPPGGAGFFDAGPFVGLWSTAAALRVLMSFKWAKGELQAQGILPAA